jgi:hypothetical protein
MRFVKQLPIFLLFVLILIYGCVPNNNSTLAPEQMSSSYPVFPTSIPSGYPSPQITSEFTEPYNHERPTQDPTLGAVKGVLQLKTSTGIKPVDHVILYLAEVVRDTEGNERVVSMDRLNSPRAYTDMNGYFEFFNVPPGKYGLVLDTITNSYLLGHPVSGEDMLFEVRAGEVLDTGVLVYNMLPISR